MSDTSWDSLMMVIVGIKGLLTLAAVFPAVLGIIILCKRKKYWQFGVSLILSGVIGFYSEVGRYIILMNGTAVAARTMSYVGLVASLLSFASTILLFLYAKQNYKAKGMPIVVCVPLGSWILTIALRFFLFRSDYFDDIHRLNAVNSIINVVSAIPTVAVMIFITVVYFKNKDKEPASKLWIFIAIIAAISALGAMGSLMSIDLAVSIINVVSYGGRSALGIYLLVAGKKALSVTETEIDEE